MNTTKTYVAGIPVSCPICGSERRTLYGPLTSPSVANMDDFSLAQCCDCSLYYCYPMPDITKHIKVFYDKGYFEHEDCRTGDWSRDYKQLLNDSTVRKWFSLLRQEKLCGGKKFLDVGCGRGLFVAVACEFGWDAHGFDVTDANRTEIESQCGACIEVGESPLQRFGEAVFDALFCNQVLEHTQQPVGFMEELKALLKPGGTLFLSFPNENALMHVYERTVKRLLQRPPITQQPLQSPYHILGFTQKAFDRLVKMGGWEVCWSKRCWGADIFLRDTYQKPHSLRGRLYDRVFYWMAILGDKLNMGRYFQVVLRKPAENN